MPIHPFTPMQGRLEILTIQSKALAGNILGDPHERRVAVYLPPGYTHDRTYPLMVDIVGFTGSGFSHLGWKAFAETLPQRVERLVSEGKMGEVILAFPDCFTRLGGNQYINTPVMGNWADFLIEEMVPALEEHFSLIPGREGRALFGKSSGGYGSLIHGMRYPEAWGAIACHSGDLAFELCYRHCFPGLLDRLACYDNPITDFIDYLEQADKVTSKDLHHLMLLAMAASYDPAPEMPHGVRLPLDLHTCKYDETLWQRWLEHDPVVLIERKPYQQALKSLSGLYIDCGVRDQFQLHYGARQFHAHLEAAGVPHVYQEFDDDHTNIDYRMDRSLPFLYRALTR